MSYLYPNPPTGGSGNFGQSTVTFPTLRVEASADVTGQTGITGTSRVIVAIFSNGDDSVVVQDWAAPVVSDLVPGVGFTITLRPANGRFQGPVVVNWSYA